MARKREFNFDEMLGLGPAPKSEARPKVGRSQTSRTTGTQESRNGRVPGLVEELEDEPLGTSEPAGTGMEEPVPTEDQEPSATPREGPGGEGPVDLIEAVLKDHAGLRTGTAKKTTFDFTPEFARALKRWSVDTDTPMRDLVVRAVAQAMPPEYLQKYRFRKPNTRK